MTQRQLVGSTISRFQILNELGRGGMAVVYRALQPDLDRIVALKVLPANLTEDPSYVARFRQEARSAAKLEHPHIMPIYEVGEADGYHYIAMKYISGRTLKQIVQHEGAMDPVRAARYLSQVADALDYAHRRGVIHRDIKPSNVMLTEEDWVFLTDFGLARGTGGAGGAGAGLTVAGTVMGTPEYMSPEQAQGLPTIGPPTDIYAMGVMLYELLTGNFPFHGDTPLMVMSARLFKPPIPPRDIRPDLPVEVENVVMRALARKPEARFATAGELIEALRVALHIPAAALRPGAGMPRGQATTDAPAGSTPSGTVPGTASPQRGTPLATPASPARGTPPATPPSPARGAPLATPPSPARGTPPAAPPSPARGSAAAGLPYDAAATVGFERSRPQVPSYPPQQAPSYPPQQAPSYPPQQAPSYPPQQAPSYPPQQAPSYPPQQAPSAMTLPTASLPPGAAVPRTAQPQRRGMPIAAVALGLILTIAIGAGAFFWLNRGPTPDDLVAEGTNLFLAGDMDGAEARFQQVLNSEPGSAPARLALAQLATARGDWNQLVAEAETAVGLGDARQDALAYSYLAIGQMNLDDYPAAEQSIQRALDIDDSQALAHAAEAALLAERAEFSRDSSLLDAAFVSLERAGRTIGSDAALDAAFAYNLLGSVYAYDFGFHQNRDLLESAIQIHERAIDLTPAMALHHIGLAFVYYDFADDVEAARGEIREALRLEPDSAYTLSGAGWASQRENDLDEARNYFEQALSRDPAHFEARYGLGFIAVSQGDYETAISTLQQLADEVPNNLLAYTWLGDAYAGRAWAQTDKDARRADFEAAEKMYLIAIDNGNQTTWSWYGLGVVLRSLAIEQNSYEFSASNEALERAVAADDSNAAAMIALSYNMLESDDLERAEQMAKQAVDSAPEMAEAYFAHGLALEYLKRYEEALVAYESAAAIDPNFSGLSDAIQRTKDRLNG